jgi:hypothetical protein
VRTAAPIIPGRHHHDVDALRHVQQPERHVVAGRHHQRVPGGEPGRDLLGEHRRLHLVRDQQQRHVGGPCGVRDGAGVEACVPSGRQVLVVAVAHDQLADAAVPHVLDLCRALVAVAEDGDGAAGEHAAVGVGVGVDGRGATGTGRKATNSRAPIQPCRRVRRESSHAE